MLKIALVGAELEENLGLRYMTSTLEREKHRVKIVPFNTEQDISQTLDIELGCPDREDEGTG